MSGDISGDDLRQLYRRWLLELWNGDYEVAPRIVAPDFVIHQARLDEAESEQARGPEAVVSMIGQGREPFTDISLTLDVGPVAEGDLVAARWTFRGRYRGGIPGATAPEGTPFTLSGMDMLRARDGRFVEYWVSSDALQAMAALGLAPGAAG